MDARVKFHRLHEMIEGFLICWVIRVIKLWECEGISKDRHILAIFSLDRQFHQLVCILLMHLIGVGKAGTNIEDLGIVKLFKIIVDQAKAKGNRRDVLISLGFPTELHIWDK
jgi:hypothetical protein